MKNLLLNKVLVMSRYALIGIVLQIATMSLILASSNSQAQQKSISDIIISVNAKEASLHEVFRKIEQVCGLRFAFNHESLKNMPRINISAKNESLANVLETISFQSKLKFKRINENIHVSRLTDSDVKTVEEVIEIKQSRTVTGKVTSQADGETLPGVNIIEKGTSNGTVTDIDGKYSIQVSEGATLIFSSVGYTPEEVQVGARSVVDLAMVQDIQQLQELVVVGYGTMKKSDLTGSIVSVKAEDFKKYQPASVSDLLRSSVPGLKVGYSTDAKATPEFEIRGDNSIKARDSDNTDKPEREANKPLIVVDNVIFNGDLTEINVNDVESIDVLKDASAASIYGSRASNGVVVITTKRGTTSKPTIRFSTQYGIVTGAKRQKTFNGDEVMDWLVDMKESINSKALDPWSKWDQYENVPDEYKDDWLAENNIAGETDMNKITSVWLDNFGFEQNEKENYMAGKSYDWQDWLFHTGQRQDYNVSISGRTDKVNYYWSVGLRDYESVQVGEKFKSITSRLNLDVAVTDFLNMGLNANIAYEDEGQTPIDNGGYYTASPYDTPWENGMPQTRENLKKAGAGSNRGNPLLDPAFKTRDFDRYRLFPTAYATLHLPLGFELTTRFTQRLDFRKRFEFNDPSHPLWQHGGEVRRRHNQEYGWQSDNILSWKKEFGPHRFDVTGLWNAEKNQYWDTNSFTKQFTPNANLGYHEMFFGLQPSADSDDEVNTRTALMGRVNYAFEDRYNLSASIRRDGYSRFGQNNYYASFPSISAAWTITNEGFMAAAPSWLTTLKIRASWGINGNSSGLQAYNAYAKLSDNKYLNYNNGYFFVPYMYVERMQNYDLAWEKNEAYNFALDYAVFNGRIRGSIDWYTSNTIDLLLDKKLPIITGFESVITNVGGLKNKGIDFSFNTVNIENKDVSWTSSLLLHYNQNKITSLTGEKFPATDAEGNPIIDNNGNPVMIEPDDYDNGWFIGKDKDVIWDYAVDGVYQVGEEAEAAKYNLYPGDFKVVDQNGDGKLNNADKVFQGTESNPWYSTLRNEFRYKNFDIGLIFLAKLGYKGGTNWPFNNRQEYIKNHNWYNLPYWTPNNQINNYARINSIRLSGMDIYTPKSYVRFQNLSLGYNIPQRLMNKINVANAHLSFNIDNVAVWTKWEMGDPESEKEMPRIYSLSLDFSL